jgi:cysteine-S-conjugate beta-lyase
MLGICRRHGVQVISDEIHHDILMPGYQHISAASLWSGPNQPITFFSASKTFNLAGMKNSILAIPQKETRAKFDAFERSLGTGSSSTLDYIAVTAAFSGGAEWLDTVLAQIFANYQIVKETLAPFPQITISPLEGTYLLWLDLGNVVPREQLHAFVQTECGLAPDYGHWFFPEGVREDTHIRINLAAPQATIQKAAKQLAEGIRKELADA